MKSYLQCIYFPFYQSHWVRNIYISKLFLKIFYLAALIINLTSCAPTHSINSDAVEYNMHAEHTKSDNHHQTNLLNKKLPGGNMPNKKRDYPTEGILLGKREYPTEGILLGKRDYPTEGILLGKREYPTEGILLGKRDYPTEGILLGKRDYPTEGILLGKRDYPTEGILLGKRDYPTEGILLGKRGHPTPEDEYRDDYPTEGILIGKRNMRF